MRSFERRFLFTGTRLIGSFEPAAVAVRYRQPLGPQVEFVSPKVLLAQVKRLFGGKLQQEYRVDAGVRFIF